MGKRFAMALAAGSLLAALTRAAAPQDRSGSTAPPGATPPAVVYKNHFDKKPGAEWSKTDIDHTPKGRRAFLGMFGGEQVSLSLADLPPHKFVRLSFSLFMLNPVDGSSPTWGPDVWDLTVDGGPSLLHTTFDNCGFFNDNNEQAFPDEFPEAPGKPWPGWTGCDEKQTLGYVKSWGGPDRTFGVDSVYHLAFTFPNDQKALKLLFTSYSTEDKDGEAWGIGAIKVEALADGEHPDAKELERLWGALQGPDPVKAFHAKWDFIAAGEAGRAFLTEKLSGAHLDDKRVKELVQALGDDRPEVREQATKDVTDLGVVAVPLLRREMEETDFPEVRNRLRRAIAAISRGPENDPDALRHKRALHALRILAGEAAHFTPEENGRKPAGGGG